MKSKFYNVIAIIFLAIFTLFATIWSGYALSLLWLWFFVPLGAPPLTVAHSVGVTLTVTFLTYNPPLNDGLEFENAAKKYLLLSTLRPAFALLFGWIVTLFL